MELYLKNNEYEILTPSGYSEFEGVLKKSTSILFTIKFNDDTYIKCTENHLIKYTESDFLEACHVMIGDEVFGNKIITDIQYEEGNFEVYDPINVLLNNEYYSNSVISHNCAFISTVDEIWTSAQQTLATGGGAIILSTPNGVGNLFHKIWTETENSGKNSQWKGIKLKWDVHPERDSTWRELQTQLLGEKDAAQECDCSFITSGHTLVDGSILEWYEQTYVLPPIEKRSFDGNYWLWSYPNFSKKYAVIADVARGDGTDYSTFHVIDIETVEQVAEYKGKIGTTEFGHMLTAVSTEWNNALLVIENANIGWAVIQVVIDSGYNNLYYSYKQDGYVDEDVHLRKGYDMKDKGQMVPGFSTTSRTRPLIISKIETYFREKTPIVRSRRLIDELFVFIWNGHKAEARSGYNDDLVMSFGIGLWIRDTALRLQQQGIDLSRKTLTHYGKTSGVYTNSTQKPNGLNWNSGDSQNNDLTWLL